MTRLYISNIKVKIEKINQTECKDKEVGIPVELSRVGLKLATQKGINDSIDGMKFSFDNKLVDKLDFQLSIKRVYYFGESILF